MSDSFCVPPSNYARFFSLTNMQTGASPSAAPVDAPIMTPAAAVRGRPGIKKLSDNERKLLAALIVGDLDPLLTLFNTTNWNVRGTVGGRSMTISPISLILRPKLVLQVRSAPEEKSEEYVLISELQATRHCLLQRDSQLAVLRHALSLSSRYTPTLHSAEGTFNFDLLQAIYGGDVEVLEILAETALERARAGDGKQFDFREIFFDTRITMLHMAVHDR